MNNGMKKYLALATILMGATALTSPANADETIGLLGGITGGAAALAPEIMKSYDFTLKEINDQGGIRSGEKLIGAIYDDGCNPQIAADAAGKAVNISGAVAIVGPWCSGAVIAVANQVTIPAGITLVTPSGTSPVITELKDNDTVFRTMPSDEYQGQVLARTMLERGVKTIAVSYINNDYGKGFAEAFKEEYEAKGGTIAGYAGHEENKPSYRSDIAELAKSGADTLLLIDYGASSGLTVLREAIQNDFFKNYVGGEGMKAAALIETIGSENLSNVLISSPVADESESLKYFSEAFKKAGGDPNAFSTTNAYDAIFMVALAIEKSGGDKTKIATALRAISNGTGETVHAGEWKKAKELIAAGKEINYKGAVGDLDFDKNGDVPGKYSLFKIGATDFEVVQEMK